jgi:hypothetical protein
MADHRFELRRLSLSEILDEGFKIFRVGFSRFMAFQLLVSLPLLILLTALLRSGGERLISIVESEQLPGLRGSIALVGFYSVAFVLLQTAMASISAMGLSRAVADMYLSRAWTTSSILTEAIRLSRRAVLLGLTYGTMLFMTLFIPVVLLGGGVAVLGRAGPALQRLFSAQPTTHDAALLLLFFVAMAIGSLIGLIGALWMGVRFGLAFPVLAIERCSVSSAFARARQLIRGRFWRALGLVVFVSMLSAFIGGALAAFVPVPSFEQSNWAELRRLLPSLIRTQILSSTVSQAVGVITSVFSLICWTLFYFTARVESEGFNLDALGKG